MSHQSKEKVNAMDTLLVKSLPIVLLKSIIGKLICDQA